MKIFRHNYMVIYLLAFFFLAPGFFAYVLYMHPSWLGDSKTNKGRLISPPVLMGGSHQTARGKWQLALWSPSACEKRCIAELDRLARIRLALGRHLYEVEILLLLNSDGPIVTDPLKSALAEQDIHVLRLSLAERERLTLFKDVLEIFIMNPEHYFVLDYAPSVKSEDVFHDLKQLLTR